MGDKSPEAVVSQAKPARRRAEVPGHYKVIGKGIGKGAEVARKLIWRVLPGGAITSGVFFSGAVAGDPHNATIARNYITEGADKVGHVLHINGKMPSQEQVLVEKDQQTNFDLMYPGLNEAQTLDAISLVEQARANLDKYNGPEMAANVAPYEGLIRKKADMFGVPEDILIGMVMVESKGDKLAVSSANAKGLTQMGDLIAQKHNLHVSDDETDGRFSPPDVLEATSSELANYKEKEGTWAGAVQEWHMGEDHYQGFKRSFLERMGVKLPDINVSPENDSAAAIQKAYEEANFRINLYRLATLKYQVSPFKVLFKDEENYQIVQDPAWNDTTWYIPDVLAAIDKFYQEKPK